ncbi:hypothetical protein BDM02DRAFT_1220166 [Thelephora ganbajun]|uniref:Uncharacterized protein n=1 Tax=Thelephora ganbajun TaxID=370292 RepID=A0ACB6ZMY8_THEGA|nr:hypothetical protein BDM02DRAFT_1220166 [Thelephora ganbajun]
MPPAPKPETREMAIQTEVEYTSTGVGPLPPQYMSIAIGSPVLEYAHINIGTTPEPEPMSLASSPQEPTTTQQATALETPRPPSSDPPTMPPMEIEPSTTEVNFPHSVASPFLTGISKPRQRSLSPMEMSSTPSSPVHPPTKQFKLLTLPPSCDLHPEQKQVDTQLSPPPRESHTTDSPHPTWGTPALGWENASWDRASTSRPKSPVSSTASSRGNASPVPIPGLGESAPPPPINTSGATLISEPEPTKNEAATPVLPPSPIPSRDAQRTPSRDAKQEEAVPRLPSQGVSSEHSRSPSTKQHEPLSWDRPEPSSRPYREFFPPRGKHQDRTQRPPATVPTNAQYRGIFEEGDPRNYGWNNTSISATDSWGGPASYDAPPEFEGYRTRGRPNGRGLSDQGENSKNPSRPELRSLVNLTSGPIDNPLGIRPASSLRKIKIPPRSALQRGKDESKKGVIIGSDWPKNKPNGGGPPPLRYPEEDSPITDHLPQRGRKWICGCAPSRSLMVSCSLRRVERKATPEFCSQSYDQSYHPGCAKRYVGNHGIHPPP